VLAVLAGLATVAGLVLAAAGRPARVTRRQRRTLDYLVSRLDAGDLTRDQAADGSVLARKLNAKDVESRFRRSEASLRRPRA
jgi:HAMP domain-containing protein